MTSVILQIKGTTDRETLSPITPGTTAIRAILENTKVIRTWFHAFCASYKMGSSDIKELESLIEALVHADADPALSYFSTPTTTGKISQNRFDLASPPA